jgi:hypothetical protein
MRVQRILQQALSGGKTFGASEVLTPAIFDSGVERGHPVRQRAKHATFWAHSCGNHVRASRSGGQGCPRSIFYHVLLTGCASVLKFTLSKSSVFGAANKR